MRNENHARFVTVIKEWFSLPQVIEEGFFCRSHRKEWVSLRQLSKRIFLAAVNYEWFSLPRSSRYFLARCYKWCVIFVVNFRRQIILEISFFTANNWGGFLFVNVIAEEFSLLQLSRRDFLRRGYRRGIFYIKIIDEGFSSPQLSMKDFHYQNYRWGIFFAAVIVGGFSLSKLSMKDFLPQLLKKDFLCRSNWRGIFFVTVIDRRFSLPQLLMWDFVCRSYRGRFFCRSYIGKISFTFYQGKMICTVKCVIWYRYYNLRLSS